MGAIEAAHIPILTGLTPLFNWRMLPKELQPFLFTFWETVLAVVYLLQLTDVLGTSA